MLRRTVVRLLAGVDQSEVWVYQKNGFRFGFKPVIRETKKEA